MWWHLAHLIAHGVGIGLFYSNKTENRQRPALNFGNMHYDVTILNWHIFLMQWPILCFINKTQNRHFAGCHMSLFFGPNIVFFLVIFLRDHDALIFTHFIHELILLFSRFEFAQDSKNFWEVDKIDVQKSICRNLFGKFDALLGVLRNFFWSIFGRPYMQWKNQCA